MKLDLTETHLVSFSISFIRELTYFDLSLCLSYKTNVIQVYDFFGIRLYLAC